MVLAASLSLQAAQPAATDLITVEQARDQLRHDALPVPIGMVLLAVGLVTAALSFLRRRSGSGTLASIGVFSFLYGGRLIIEGGSVQLLFNLDDRVLSHLLTVLSYLIPIPAIVSAIEILGPGWRSSLRWLLRVQILFSGAALVVYLILGGTAGAENLVRLMAILAVAGIVGNAVWHPEKWRGWQLLMFGVMVLAMSVVIRNLSDSYLGRGVEAVGVLVFVCCLGFVSAQRMFADEKRLLEMDAEMESARKIQASILPRTTPALPGLEIATRYCPMTAVAGDFFDFLVIDDRRIGILMADVSGHGVPAALVASMVKVGFQAQVSHAADPAKVLSGLNSVLHGQLDSQFVTAVYVFVDLTDAKMHYAGAAHPPIYLCGRGDGSVHLNSENGLMLGPFAEPPYSSSEASLTPGDRLVLVTDGILEAASPSGEFFGEGRLKTFLAEHSELPPDRFADSLLDDVSRWTGADFGRLQDDDITLLVADIERT